MRFSHKFCSIFFPHMKLAVTHTQKHVHTHAKIHGKVLLSYYYNVMSVSQEAASRILCFVDYSHLFGALNLIHYCNNNNNY